MVTESANKAASAEGWISGTYDVSGDCQGLPASVCKQCGQSKNPDKCLKCARDPRAQFSKKPINYLIKQGNKAQSACAVCAGLGDAALQARWAGDKGSNIVCMRQLERQGSLQQAADCSCCPVVCVGSPQPVVLLII